MRSAIIRSRSLDAANLPFCARPHRRGALRKFAIGFHRRRWGLVEPTAFMSNWHIEAICDHLEAAPTGRSIGC